MREGKSGESTQSSCITSSSLVSFAAIFVSIFTQRTLGTRCFSSRLTEAGNRARKVSGTQGTLNATTLKKSRVSEYFLPTSPHIPFKNCFPFQTKLNPCMEFKEKLEPECIILFFII